MTLIEVLVVLVLIAIFTGVVGPSIANRLDNLELQVTASRLAVQFRSAQVAARAGQAPVAAVYSDHEFRFFKGTRQIGSFQLPSAISPGSQTGSMPYLFLPSGQIIGPEEMVLWNQRDKSTKIHIGLLTGIGLDKAGVL
jgi:prepilin-type N-terminal cleavage/methylation domain-containing protein